jgi:hypothetical protein
MAINRSSGSATPSVVSACFVMLLIGFAAPSAFAQGWTTAPAGAPDAGAIRATPPTLAPAPGRPVPSIHRGWPQTMGIQPSFRPSGIVLADVDLDGDLEVLAGSTDNLFRVWRQDGTLMPGWPIDVGGVVETKAAAADLDGDGDLEILISVKNGPLRVYHHDGTVLDGWPRTSGVIYAFISPTVCDLDGDGRLEVMIGGGSTVRAWRADGTPIFSTSVGSNITGTLAVGDVNGDEFPEIFAVTLNGQLWCLDRHGVSLPGWPAVFGLTTSWAAPSIGDIDADGYREVLVVGGNINEYTNIFGYRWTPTHPELLPGFPLIDPSPQTYSCPVLADADGDGDLEIWNAGKIIVPNFYAWDHTGALLPGWPLLADNSMESSPIVCDFDGLPGPEIALADNRSPGFIFGYNLDGSVATGFPFSKPGGTGPNSPEVGDIDQDGLLEMGLTMITGDVVLWDFPVAYDESAVEWGTWFHDDWNTNQYGFVVPGPAGVEDRPSRTGREPLRVFPNPTTAELTIPVDRHAAGPARLIVLDVEGRRVAQLFDGVLGAGPSRFVWDGRDARGRPAPAGLYRVRLEGGPGEARTARAVVLR